MNGNRGKHAADRTPRREHAVHVPGQARRPWGLEWSYLGEEGHGGEEKDKVGGHIQAGASVTCGKKGWRWVVSPWGWMRTGFPNRRC